MVIRNQSHDALFILEKGTIIQVNTTCVVMFLKGDKEQTIIGRYHTEERALEVLNEVFDNIEKGKTTYSIPLC